MTSLSQIYCCKVVSAHFLYSNEGPQIVNNDWCDELHQLWQISTRAVKYHLRS